MTDDMIKCVVEKNFIDVESSSNGTITKFYPIKGNVV